ncbi:MAG: carbamoyltransferase, partial [Candidatus Omnitrophica bacterium]|nr:carbamoyltransferase [Candidatus Omnitrophota bacterium]
MSKPLIVIGINAYHPDASVALLRDGQLLWAGEEERYNRVKHSSGFPKLALECCLEETGTNPSEVDVVAISKNPLANLARKVAFILKHNLKRDLVLNRLKAFRSASQFKQDFFKSLKVSENSMKAKFVHVEHHQAHAASSFFLSGFDRAAFLSIDGMGDFSSAMWGVGKGNQLQVMSRVYFPHSAGFLYTAGTQFLGFLNFGDEYKVMGLAAYGKPVYLDLFCRMVHLKKDGRFELDLSYFVHHKGKARIRWEDGVPEQDILYSGKWNELFGTPRAPQGELHERHSNLAASLQALLEEIYFHVLGDLYRKTKEKNLCLAGGVAFNSVANGKIKAHTPFGNVYIQPAAGDAGTALGAAAFVYHSVLRRPRTFVMNHAFLGSGASGLQIEQTLREKNLSYQKLSEEELVQKTAQTLCEGKIVGWFQGRM